MKNSKDAEAKIEMQNCEAYETISAIKRRHHAAMVHVQSYAQS